MDLSLAEAKLWLRPARPFPERLSSQPRSVTTMWRPFPWRSRTWSSPDTEWVVRRGAGNRLDPVGAEHRTGVDPEPCDGYLPNSRYLALASRSHALASITNTAMEHGMLVITAIVKGFDKPFRVLIDSGASRNYARQQSLAADPTRYD